MDYAYVDRIMEIQKEIDVENDNEYNEKLKLKEKIRDEQRWDKKNGCLRHPCITKLQQSLFFERDQLVESLPDFWTTALGRDSPLPRYMNEEEQKVFKYLKSVNVKYHGDAKSGYTIQLHFRDNPYFNNDCLTKDFWFSCKGISIRSGTEIKWTKKGKDIEAFAEKGGTQSQSGLPSFFKWFREDSEKRHDLVAEFIVQGLWPNAHINYFFKTEMDKCAGEGMTTRAKQLKVDTLSKLMTISDELRAAKHEAYKERYAMEEKYDLELVRRKRELHMKYETSRRIKYKRREEIIENIPDFWLIAFSSHYALHHLLSIKDRKILKFLNSVNVKETEGKKGVTSGYTITLEFAKNPYFANKKLTKTISYTAETESPPMEYSCDEVDISVSDIQWKNGTGITTRGFADQDTSFFTWFSGLACVPMKAKTRANDEVADLIKEDFWPNAGKYFVNENLNDD